ncbi:MAG: hypothetical protein WDM84_00615 [Bauldia sp.]
MRFPSCWRSSATPPTRASVAEFVDRRDQIGAWLAAAGSLDAAIADLRRALGVAGGETAAALRADVIGDAALDTAAARRLIDLLSGNGGKDRDAAARLTPYVEAADAGHRVDGYLAFFMKDDGDPRVAKSLVTNAAKNAWTGLAELLEAELLRLAALMDRVRTAELFESTAAMLRLAEAAHRRIRTAEAAARCPRFRGSGGEDGIAARPRRCLALGPLQARSRPRAHSGR